MKYVQLNAEERSEIATLKRLGWSVLEMARELGRHRSTVARELARNATPHDGWYRAGRAHARAVARRRRSRRNSQFGKEEWGEVETLLRKEWSPEQVSGYLQRSGELEISHETIYRHVWRDREGGGSLHLHLRCAQKQCRKRYGRHDSRGRLAGKRMIGERPAAVETRRQVGHWEIDTVMGQSLGESSDCILTLVERKSGYVPFGRLRALSFVETAHRQAACPHRGASEQGVAGPDEEAPRKVQDDHLRQRDRVPRRRTDRSGERGEVLLRHSPS